MTAVWPFTGIHSHTTTNFSIKMLILQHGLILIYGWLEAFDKFSLTEALTVKVAIIQMPALN